MAIKYTKWTKNKQNEQKNTKWTKNKQNEQKNTKWTKNKPNEQKIYQHCPKFIQIRILGLNICHLAITVYDFRRVGCVPRLFKLNSLSEWGAAVALRQC
jgi:hypothetical protein